MNNNFQHGELSFNHKKSNSQLIDILLSPALISEVRAKNSAFFINFEKDSIINELAEWCFTTKYNDHPRHNEISKIAVSVLLSSPLSLIQFSLKSHSFAKVLYNFLISDDSKNARLCSHFSEVLTIHIKFGTPLLFTNFPKVQKHLLNRIENLAIRNFIIVLITSNVNYINSGQMITDLCSLADENLNENALYLLHSIYRTMKTENRFKDLFNNKTVLNHLLNAAIQSKSAVIQSDLFQCLSDLNFNTEMIYDQQLKEKLTIDESNINDLTISAIDIFQLSTENLITLFFSKSSTARLRQKILNKIDCSNMKELIEIANTQNFLVDVMNSFGTENWSPECFQIVLIFFNVEGCCKPLKSKRWNTFIRDKFYRYIKILNNEYGGHAPSQCSEEMQSSMLFDSDDDNSDDIKNMTFEEEEDFYDDNILYYEEDGVDIENIETSDEDEVEFDIDI